MPIVAGAIRFRNFTVTFKRFYYFLLFSAAFEILIITLGHKGIRNDWILHFYTPIEFSVITFVLYSWQFNQRVQRFIYYTASLLVMIWLAYFIAMLIISSTEDHFDFKANFGAQEPVTFAIEAIVLNIFSILLLFNLYGLEHPPSLIRSKKFWFAVSVLVYFSGNITFYVTLNTITRLSAETGIYLWIIHSLFNFLGYLFLAIAFLCRR